MVNKKIETSNEIFEKIFKEINLLCSPVGSYSVGRENRLNPVVVKCLKFLFEVVESLDDNLEKLSFLELFWRDLSSYLYKELLKFNIPKLDDKTTKGILTMENRLHDKFKEFKKGEGLENFFINKFDNFLKKSKKEKNDWEKLIEKSKAEKSEEIGDIDYYFLS